MYLCEVSVDEYHDLDMMDLQFGESFLDLVTRLDTYILDKTATRGGYWAYKRYMDTLNI